MRLVENIFLKGEKSIMMRFLKKALVGTLATLMLASSVFAANGEMDNMVFVGYDVSMYETATKPYVDGFDFNVWKAAVNGTTPFYTAAPETVDWDAPMKVYKEVINGVETGKIVKVPVAADWRFEGYEAVYPYAGYYRLYLEGNWQDITDYQGNKNEDENLVFPQWESKRVDYMWQVSYPYTVWERQQTLVNGVWTWDFGNDSWGILDSALLVPTNREATLVEVTWDDYGFGQYDNEGNYLTLDELAMYDYFEVEAALVNLEEVLNVERLSARDAKGAYVMTDAKIAAEIPVVKSKNVTAKFNKEGDEGLTTKDVAVEWLAHRDWTDWDNGIAVFACDTINCGCHAKWTFNEKRNNPCNDPRCACKSVLANESKPYGLVEPASFYVDKTSAKIEWSPVYHELCEPYRQYQFLIVNGVALDGSLQKYTVNGVTFDIARERVLRYTGGFHKPVITWNFAFYQAADGRYVEQRYVDGVPEVDANGNGVYRIPEIKFEDSHKTPEGLNGHLSAPGWYTNFYQGGAVLGLTEYYDKTNL